LAVSGVFFLLLPERLRSDVFAAALLEEAFPPAVRDRRVVAVVVDFPAFWVLLRLAAEGFLLFATPTPRLLLLEL
jgi:hypothetical protein